MIPLSANVLAAVAMRNLLSACNRKTVSLLKNCHPAVSAVNAVIAITRQRRSKGSAVRLRLESCKRQQIRREKPRGKTILFQEGNPS
jgi:hypothetical protein